MYPVHFEVVLGGLYLKNVFQMGGGGLRGKKFMFSQEASNFSFFITIKRKRKKKVFSMVLRVLMMK